ncbi:MAG TPA: hypothetical protein VGF39_05840, partial [Stellaceae bacterium]
MCTPLAIGVISAVGSAASAGVSYMGQQATLDAQRKANADWVATQQAASQRAAALDETARQKADAARQTALQQISPQNQQAVQQTKQADLTTQFLSGTPAAPDANTSVLGLDPSDTAITSDISKRVTNAARDAQGRIQALAGLSSYGGGVGAAGDVAGTALANAGDTIGLASDERTGDARTLGIAQNIQP